MARPTCLYCGARAAARRRRQWPGRRPSRPRARDRRPRVAAGAGPARGGAGAAGRGARPSRSSTRGSARSGGGCQLHRVAAAGRGREEAGRLRRRGLAVPCSSRRRRPRRAARPAARCAAAAAEAAWSCAPARARCRVTPGALFLVVARPDHARVPDEPGRSSACARPRWRAGHRIHLHRPDDPRPLELDPLAFDFGARRAAVALVAAHAPAAGWSRRRRGTPVDDGFRRLTPALAPAAARRRRAAGRGRGPARAPRAARRRTGRWCSTTSSSSGPTPPGGRRSSAPSVLG